MNVSDFVFQNFDNFSKNTGMWTLSVLFFYFFCSVFLLFPFCISFVFSLSFSFFSPLVARSWACFVLLCCCFSCVAFCFNALLGACIFFDHTFFSFPELWCSPPACSPLMLLSLLLLLCCCFESFATVFAVIFDGTLLLRAVTTESKTFPASLRPWTAFLRPLCPQTIHTRSRKHPRHAIKGIFEPRSQRKPEARSKQPQARSKTTRGRKKQCEVQKP